MLSVNLSHIDEKSKYSANTHFPTTPKAIWQYERKQRPTFSAITTTLEEIAKSEFVNLDDNDICTMRKEWAIELEMIYRCVVGSKDWGYREGLITYIIKSLQVITQFVINNSRKCSYDCSFIIQDYLSN